MGEARGQGWRAASKVVTPSEGKYEALYCSSMEMHRQSREIAHQQMQEMSDELSKKGEENQRLRELLKESLEWLRDECIDDELIDKIEMEIGGEEPTMSPNQGPVSKRQLDIIKRWVR